MKILLVMAVIFSSNGYSETKAVKGSAPAKADATAKSSKEAAATEAPCADTKEDVLKKLEEKKKAQAQVNKGFSLQGGNDTGCSIK